MSTARLQGSVTPNGTSRIRRRAGFLLRCLGFRRREPKTRLGRYWRYFERGWTVVLLVYAGLETSNFIPEARAFATTNTGEVFLTGNERAIIERFGEKVELPLAAQFSNSLDHCLAVLVAKAFPKPQSAALARAAVVGLAKEHEHETGRQVSATHREAWVSTIVRTRSFESVLKDLARTGVKSHEVLEAGLVAMLGASGWSSACVLSPSEAEELKKTVNARERPAEGRGVLGIMLDHWPVVEVAPGAPAAEAGLRDGDRLIMVDGKDAGTAKTPGQALKLLQGPAGAVVKLTADWEGEKISFEVKRASAGSVQVTSETIQPGVLLIRIATFEGSGIAERVKHSLAKAGPGKDQSVLLDLRDNEGGRPEEANAVADIFLENKLLQICEFRDGRPIAFKSNPSALDLRVIVLTNKRTGSAAEMLAMALRDNSRATIVGERTAGALFGKDIAELVGGQTILFRTEPTVLSPTGRDYSLTGIPPDVEIADVRNKGRDAVLSRALDLARPR